MDTLCFVSAGKLADCTLFELSDDRSKLAVERYLQKQKSGSRLDEVLDVVIESGVFKVGLDGHGC